MTERSLPARTFDWVFGVLMRPRIRRLRRWAFLVTVPAGLFGAKALGIDLNVRTGLKAGKHLPRLTWRYSSPSSRSGRGFSGASAATFCSTS